jgi:hypothetical protein
MSLLTTKLLDVAVQEQIIYWHYIYQTLNFFSQATVNDKSLYNPDREKFETLFLPNYIIIA